MAKIDKRNQIVEVDGVPTITLQEGYVIKQPLSEKLVQLSKLDHIEFEHFLSRMFAIKGYEVKFTPVFNDGGADMIITRKGQITAVRCVLSKEQIGKDMVEATLKSMDNYSVHDTMIITDNFFTREASHFAKKKPITLVDRKGLIEDFLKEKI